MKPINRRTVLQAASGTAALAMLPAHASDSPDKAARAVAEDGHLTISFDAALRTSLRAAGKTLTGWDPSESLLLAAGPADNFAFVEQRAESLADAAHGAGRRTIVTGRTRTGLEKQVRVDFFDRYPGFALLQVTYRNTGDTTARGERLAQRRARAGATRPAASGVSPAPRTKIGATGCSR